MRTSLLLIIFTLSLMLGGCANPKPNTTNQPTVQIKDQTLTVEIADTVAERAQGLSGRSPLSEGHAMLFVFPEPVQGTFWMNQMNFPLDVIWILDNKIVDLDKNIPPPAQTNNIPQTIYPDSPYTHVIEIGGGWSDQHQINIGDPVVLQL